MRLPDVPDPGQVSFAPAPIVAGFDAGGDWHDPGSGEFAKAGWSTAKAAAVAFVRGLLAREHARDRPEGVLLALRADAPADLRGRLNTPEGAVLARYKDDRYAVVVDVHKRQVLVPWDHFADPVPSRVEVPGQKVLPFRSPRKPKIQPLGHPAESRYLSAEAIRSNRRKHPEMNALWERLTDEEFQHMGRFWLPAGSRFTDEGGYWSTAHSPNWAANFNRAVERLAAADLDIDDPEMDYRFGAPRWFLEAVVAMDDYTGDDGWVTRGGEADRLALIAARRGDPEVFDPTNPADRAAAKALIEEHLPNGHASIVSPLRRDLAAASAAALAELPEADRRHIRFFTFGHNTESPGSSASATPAVWGWGPVRRGLPPISAPGMHIDMNYDWFGQTTEWFDDREAKTKAFLAEHGPTRATSLGTLEAIGDPAAKARLSVLHEVGHAVDFTALGHQSVAAVIDEMNYAIRPGEASEDALLDRRLDGVVTTPYGATTPLEAFAEAYAIHHSGVVPEAAAPFRDRIAKAVERRSQMAAEAPPIVNELADRPEDAPAQGVVLVDYFDGTRGPELITPERTADGPPTVRPASTGLVDATPARDAAGADRAPVDVDLRGPGWQPYRDAFDDGSIFGPTYAAATITRSSLAKHDVSKRLHNAWVGYVNDSVGTRGFHRLAASTFDRDTTVLDALPPLPGRQPVWKPDDDTAALVSMFRRTGEDAVIDAKLAGRPAPEFPVPDEAAVAGFLRAVYDHTQQYLASLGLHPDDKVVLYRGLGAHPYQQWNDAGRSDRLDSLPLAAFAADAEFAARYGDKESGGVIAVTARVGDILSVGLLNWPQEVVTLAPADGAGFHVTEHIEPDLSGFRDEYPDRAAWDAAAPDGIGGQTVIVDRGTGDPTTGPLRVFGIDEQKMLRWRRNNGATDPRLDGMTLKGIPASDTTSFTNPTPAERLAADQYGWQVLGDLLFPPAPVVNELAVNPLGYYISPGVERWAEKLAASDDRVKEALAWWSNDWDRSESADRVWSALTGSVRSRRWIDDTLTSPTPDLDAVETLRQVHSAAVDELGGAPHPFVRDNESDDPFAASAWGASRPNFARTGVASWYRTDGPFERSGRSTWGSHHHAASFTVEQVLGNLGGHDADGEYLVAETPETIDRLMAGEFPIVPPSPVVNELVDRQLSMSRDAWMAAHGYDMGLIDPYSDSDAPRAAQITAGVNEAGRTGDPLIPESKVIDTARSILTTAAADVRNDRLLVRVTTAAVPKIIEDGRIKTMFETRSSRGASKPALRFEHEQQAFGIPNDFDRSKRPIYGYVATDNTETGVAASYGHVAFALKGSQVADRTTLSLGDSLKSSEPLPLVSIPVADPDQIAAATGWTGARLVRDAINDIPFDHYVEAQVHGGVTTDDIAAVWTLGDYPDTVAAAQAAADALGVPLYHGTPDDEPTTWGATRPPVVNEMVDPLALTALAGAPAAVVQGVSPLRYHRGRGPVRRLAIVDPTVAYGTAKRMLRNENDATNMDAPLDYFAPTVTVGMGRNGQRLKTPKTVPNPAAAVPGTLGFVDYEERPDGSVYIHYANTHGDHTRQGVANRLVHDLAARHPGATLDFGKVMTPSMWGVLEQLRAEGVNVTGRPDFGEFNADAWRAIGERKASGIAPTVNELVDPLALEALTADPVVSKITSAYADAGHPVYIVGGAIRSVLQGQAPNDIDLTTPALPAESTETLDKVGTVFPLGEKFGTVVVNIDGLDYEVTTHRTEAYDEDSRKPVTQFTTSLADDLARRDFTFNAMALDTDGTLIDPFDGQADLAAGVVRAVGDPAERFSEDPLRIVRAVRFAAVNGFKLDPATRDAAKATADAGRLDILSRERFNTELDKILKSPRPDVVEHAVRFAEATGSLDALFGPLAPAARRATRENRVQFYKIAPEHRFAALVWDAHVNEGLDPSSLVGDMKRGRSDMGDLAVIVAAGDEMLAPDITQASVIPKRIVRRLDDRQLGVLAAIQPALWAPGSPGGIAVIDRDTYRRPLPVDGNDMLELGLVGPQVRQALDKLTDEFLGRSGRLPRHIALQLADPNRKRFAPPNMSIRRYPDSFDGPSEAALAARGQVRLVAADNRLAKLGITKGDIVLVHGTPDAAWTEIPHPDGTIRRVKVKLDRFESQVRIESLHDEALLWDTPEAFADALGAVDVPTQADLDLYDRLRKHLFDTGATQYPYPDVVGREYTITGPKLTQAGRDLGVPDDDVHRIVRQQAVMWHSTPTGDVYAGAGYGLHVGTYQAAREASRFPKGTYDGTLGTGDPTRPWDGTILYDGPVYTSNGPKSGEFYPDLFPLLIVGPMNNARYAPATDDYANGRMTVQVTKGQAKSGYYYLNHVEDSGSISAVVPSGDWIVRLNTRDELRRVWADAHADRPAPTVNEMVDAPDPGRTGPAERIADLPEGAEFSIGEQIGTYRVVPGGQVREVLPDGAVVGQASVPDMIEAANKYAGGVIHVTRMPGDPVDPEPVVPARPTAPPSRGRMTAAQVKAVVANGDRLWDHTRPAGDAQSVALLETQRLLDRAAADLARVEADPDGIQGWMGSSLWKERRGLTLERADRELLGLARRDPDVVAKVYMRNRKRFDGVSTQQKYRDLGPVEEPLPPEVRSDITSAWEFATTHPMVQQALAKVGAPPPMMFVGRYRHGHESERSVVANYGDNVVWLNSNGTMDYSAIGLNTDITDAPGIGATTVGRYDRRWALVHETGHYVHDRLAMNGGGIAGVYLGGPDTREWQRLWDAYHAAYIEAFAAEETFDARGEVNKRQVSYYSHENFKEGFAETFSLVAAGADPTGLTPEGRALYDWMAANVFGIRPDGSPL